MTSETTTAPKARGSGRWPEAIASLLAGAGFFSLWFWLLPPWLRFSIEAANGGPWRWIALIPAVLGFSAALRCVWDFGWTGHGTPAPMAPPKRLVVVGLYRYVRNPMYLGFATGWIGLWVVFGHAVPSLIFAVVAIALGVHLFVLFYEEPTLQRKFGRPYEQYRQNVHRWLPRPNAWKTTE